MSFDFSNINPCGGCCDECEYKKNRECKGCREVDGKCVKLWTNECLIYKCCTRHKAYFCGVCNEFPCKWIINKINEWDKNGIEKLKRLTNAYLLKEKERGKMGQLTNLQAIRLYKSIERNIGKAAADDFAEKLPLSKSATFERKFKWAKDVCEYLESTYSRDDIKKIRMDCACGPSKQQMDDLKALFLSSNSLKEFAEKSSCEYYSIWCEDDTLFLSYPRCYCSCVKRSSETLSEAWCMCTLGYTKRFFDYALNCDTRIELIESVKTGGSRCVIKITKE